MVLGERIHMNSGVYCEKWWKMKDRNEYLVKITQGGFYLNAVVWLVLGLATWFRAQNPMMVVVICVLILGNVLALLWVGWGLGRRKKFFYLLGVALIWLNFVLTLTDEVGVMDLIVLVLNGALMVLLFLIRGEYLGTKRGK
jgi:hypothetical protein